MRGIAAAVRSLVTSLVTLLVISFLRALPPTR